MEITEKYFEENIQETREVVKQLDEQILALPQYVKKMLIEYTKNSRGINYALRTKNKEMLGRYADMIAGLDIAFRLVKPIEKSITVLRGIDLFDTDRARDYGFSTEGQPTEEDISSGSMDGGFISTTTSIAMAKSFTYHSSCCMLVINVPIGSRVLSLARISDFKHEAEVLLYRDGRIRVVDPEAVVMYGDVQVFKCQYTPRSIPIEINTDDLWTIVKNSDIVGFEKVLNEPNAKIALDLLTERLREHKDIFTFLKVLLEKYPYVLNSSDKFHKYTKDKKLFTIPQMMKYIYSYSGIDILGIFSFNDRDVFISLIQEYGLDEISDESTKKKIREASTRFGVPVQI